MQREIKFRGKRVDTGEWVYGLFGNCKIENLIVPCIEIYKEWDSGDYIGYIEIDGETLGQFTGVYDKNDVEIYEGDKVKCNGFESIIKFSIKTGYRIVDRKDRTMGYKGYTNLGNAYKNIEVIGNIYEEAQNE